MQRAWKRWPATNARSAAVTTPGPSVTPITWPIALPTAGGVLPESAAAGTVGDQQQRHSKHRLGNTDRVEAGDDSRSAEADREHLRAFVVIDITRQTRPRCSRTRA